MVMSENRNNRENDKFVQTSSGNTAVRITNEDGSPVGVVGTPFSYHEDSSSTLTGTTVKAAPAAGTSVYITDISVSTGAATALNFSLKEGSTIVFGPIYLEATAGRGFVCTFKTPKKITAATAVTITTSASIAHSVDIQGYVL